MGVDKGGISETRESVYLPYKTYLQLRKDSCKLHALENTGVDCWEGYREAMEAYKDYLEDEGLSD